MNNLVVVAHRVVGYCAFGLLLLGGCGGASSPGGEQAGDGASVPQVSLSGTLSYDSVAHLANGGLDYSSVSPRPLRVVTVQALRGETLVAETRSNHQGIYQLSVATNTPIRLRVRAELQQSGTPSWAVQVSDNTRDNALYVMDGEATMVGNRDTVRDLHAGIAWDGNGYSGPRVAAPFAIVDAVYEAQQAVLAATGGIDFAPLQLYWSDNNVAVPGNRSAGLIGTSFYDPSEQSIYLLGDSNNDSDEFDKSVIQHEWAHYLEDTQSRSDNIGGRHDLSGPYDMRVAFSEGWANAFSGIASAQPFYADSSGIGQALGFRFSMESNRFGNPGWFSENSVTTLLYDLADDNNEGDDTLSLGFAPLYRALTAPAYVDSPAFTSIFLFAEQLRTLGDSTVTAGLERLLAAQQITGRGIYGEGESNNSRSNISFLLPVYRQIDDGDRVNLCGNNRENEYNGVDVRRYLRFSVAQAGGRRLWAQATLSNGLRDPVIDIYWRGQRQQRIDAQGLSNREQGVFDFAVGDYVLEVYDGLNVDQNASSGGASCFDVQINRQ